MDDTIMEFMKIILSVIGTGIATFLITRYECNKDMPLDKLEITYNRVYFPIYRMIKENKSIEEIKCESEKYIQKNIKYVNKTTLIALDYLCEASKGEEQKAFTNYKNNIKKLCSKLRRKLGYLEEDKFDEYLYSSPFVKNLYRLTGELAIAYVCLGIILMFNAFHAKWNIYVCAVMIIFSVAFIVELLELMIRVVINRFRKIKKKKVKKLY